MHFTYIEQGERLAPPKFDEVKNLTRYSAREADFSTRCTGKVYYPETTWRNSMLPTISKVVLVLEGFAFERRLLKNIEQLHFRAFLLRRPRVLSLAVVHHVDTLSAHETHLENFAQCGAPHHPH